MNNPFIAFYPSKWLARAAKLTAVERGVFITLICEMYESQAPIKYDPRRLARFCGTTPATLKKCVEELLLDEHKLILKNDELWNYRVEKELKTAQKKSENQSKNSRARWEKYNKNNKKLIPSDNPRESLPEPDTDKKNIIKKDFDIGFNQLLETYPVEASKFKEAEKLYQVVINEGVPHELIIFSANRVRSEHFSKKPEDRKFTKRLNSWLAAQNFENDRKAWEQSKQPKQKREEVSPPKPILPDNHFLNKIAGGQS